MGATLNPDFVFGPHLLHFVLDVGFGGCFENQGLEARLRGTLGVQFASICNVGWENLTSAIKQPRDVELGE
jgi:hypothetical protein